MEDDLHAAAIEEAYALIEAAQGEIGLAEIDAAAVRLARPAWGDVRLLLSFARSLAVMEAGGDDSEHIRAMIEQAAELDEPALTALALAASAGRRAASKHPLDLAGSAASPLVRAVGLLDHAGGPKAHRVSAFIELGCVSHTLGLWELAIEHYDQADHALAEQPSPALRGRPDRTSQRQSIVLAINRIELVADWACAHAMIGDWEAAATRAATAFPTAPAPVAEPAPVAVAGPAPVAGSAPVAVAGLMPVAGSAPVAVAGPAPGEGIEPFTDDWPPSWAEQYRGHLHLLSALAGIEAPPVTGTIGEFVTLLAAVIRGTVRVDDPESLVPEKVTGVPPHARMLAMRLAAERAGAPEIALRYADEQATLRWNDRLHRVANVRSAIAVERRRREHDQLRLDLLTDELTGLANRRGYHAYVDDHARDAGAYAVLMVDVDHFKGVNDGFGHDVGDLVLARIAGILGEHVRQGDLAARLGGDEFVVILADMPDGIPAQRAQQIVDAVRGFTWRDLAAGLSVSVSIGVHHGGGAELPGLLTGADRNLYHAKNRGRGQAVTH
ncbi:diguanylate cyclase (GGDEF)-like protein [Actinoplanes lutulentus]|uniref:Diguanylate cyclase (GGDEF)-like protein n=1 Tax=Actinoplanes lutulentus TaxID=1287878 RepID=A0A327Z053_9ACTN|nr:GGDEF domain-containing protein [Actinoplanes lutulentus]MBB2943635.1 diguanylate cyclase (GGDEF)-like protein [Actinoplanes lutulentus]RAK27500.1 diguanylate cyclase (GGDEF)-like protein [Actinoplanes lutulentus]